MTRNKPMDIREHAKTFPNYVIAIVVALIGGYYTYATKDQEIKARYVELAISILREEPKPETGKLREWAILVVNKHASIPLRADAKKELMEHRLVSQPKFVLPESPEELAEMVRGMRLLREALQSMPAEERRTPASGSPKQ